MSDYYLTHPEALKGKPKLTIGNLMREYANVPRASEFLKEARNFGVPIIGRSEHKLEYLFSDLCESPDLSGFFSEYKNIQDEMKLKQRIISGRGKNINHIKDFCNLMNIPLNEFMRDLSFSYWEKLTGYKRIIVADSSIDGLYHIMTSSRDIDRYNEYSDLYYLTKDRKYADLADLESKLDDGAHYTLVDIKNGEINELLNPWIHDPKQQLVSLIELYETVRNVIDKTNCAIVEAFTTYEGENYFLQYHPSQNFSKSQFKLDRTAKADESKAFFVRGATKKGGETFRTVSYYGSFLREKKSIITPFEESNMFGAGDHYSSNFVEIMSSRRTCQFYSTSGLNFGLPPIIGNHINRSLLFKPNITIMIDSEKFLSKEERIEMKKRAFETGLDQYINLHAESDGRTCYVKRM